MNKTIIISLLAILTIGFETTCFASNNQELKIIENQEIISIEQVEDYKNSIKNEITSNDIRYKLLNVEQTENKCILTKDKEITEELIVTTNNKYNVLNLFETKKQVNEEDYSGILELQTDSVEIKVNDSYQEEYKVYLQKSYTDVTSNELNDIPKEIQKDGTTYYLINPVWNISNTEKVGDNDVPLTYNGIMYYEGVKVRTIIRNYIATVKYTGTLEKEVVESVSFNLKYEEIPKEANYTMPIVATTSGLIIFSGIILLRRKNVYIYNNKHGKWVLVKKINISKNNKLVDITPLVHATNKYKIRLSNMIYKELINTNITIKYFDKTFIYEIKNQEFEILV